MLLQAVGAADDPASGGRQMPSHWGSPRLNIVSQSSVGDHAVPAGGGLRRGRALFCASPQGRGAPVQGRLPAVKNVSFQGDEVVFTLAGRGLYQPGRVLGGAEHGLAEKLPVLFVVEDNGYAISTPVEVNTPGGNISRLVATSQISYFAEVDGTDPVESYAGIRRKAVAHCRARQGPGVCAWARDAAVFALTVGQ